MSKPVKEMVRKEFAARFKGLTSLAIVGFTGLDAITINRIRGRLREKQIRLLVVKNSLAKQAFKAIGLEAAIDLIEGPCAVAYGSQSVVGMVRELMEIGTESPHLTVKAAMLEGEVFKGDDQVRALSRFPTRDEALDQLAGCVMWPGASLAACLIGPAAQVSALVEAVENKASAVADARAGGAEGPAPSVDAEPPGGQAAGSQAPAPAEAGQAQAPAQQEQKGQAE